MARTLEPLAPPVDETRWPTPAEQLAQLKALPPLHYDRRDGRYWFLLSEAKENQPVGLGGILSQRWTPLKKNDLKLHFKKAGVKDIPFQNISMLDYPIWFAQTQAQVDFAGPVAGHRTGKFKCGSGTFLVTDEADTALWALDESEPKHGKPKKLIEPKFILKLIDELLPTDGDGDQGEMLKFWLGVGLESMLSHSFVPGQLVVMAGESGCGKSLMQAVITEVFGGRVANPFKFLVQGKFNGALAGAEHWAIEDPDSTSDMKTRRTIGAKLKQCLVNTNFEVELKGKDALLLPLFRRVTLTVNNEPENLSVVPPMDKSMLDKVFLFKCFPSGVGGDRQAIWAKVMEEIPHFRRWLLRYYCEAKIPRDQIDEANGRMKIKAWQHPELMDILSGLSMEAKLLGMIDETLFSEANDPKTCRMAFNGTARELVQRIRKEGQFSEIQLDKMFPFNSTCGTLLERLSRDANFKNRVLIVKPGASNSGKTIWRIEPPKEETNQKENQ